MTTYGRLFGGAPIEAGMHGVPFVGSGKTGALGDCEDYQYALTEVEACDVLNKLYNDREFYTKVGDAYRSYVKDHYTFEAFNNNLNNLLLDRNLL